MQEIQADIVTRLEVRIKTLVDRDGAKAAAFQILAEDDQINMDNWEYTTEYLSAAPGYSWVVVFQGLF